MAETDSLQIGSGLKSLWPRLLFTATVRRPVIVINVDDIVPEVANTCSLENLKENPFLLLQ